MVAQITTKMIEYFNKDVRRINHALKVYSFAKTMGEIEKLTETDQEILEIAALLHDIGILEAERKYNSTSGKYQEIEGPEVARSLLKTFSITEVALERITYLIGHHHSYECIDNLDFQILVEADFLVNIFEDEMNEQQITAILHKYFKTESGIKLIRSCYTK